MLTDKELRLDLVASGDVNAEGASLDIAPFLRRIWFPVRTLHKPCSSSRDKRGFSLDHRRLERMKNARQR
jgi:hypothetical protein